MRRSIAAVAGAIALALVVDVVTAQPPRGRDRGRGERPGPRAQQDLRGPRERPGPEGRGPAGDFRPPRMPLMVALDANGDGELSAAEIENAAEALKKLDKDGDGRLSWEELRPEFAGPGWPGGFGGPRGPVGPGGPGPGGPGGPFGPGGADFVERLMRQDSNGDGTITKDELPEPMQRILERGDTNGDGAIDRAEAERLAGRFRRAGPGSADFIERMMRFDRNGDGKVSKDELPEPMRERVLERADANGDGVIDRQEAEAAAGRFGRREGGPPRGAGGERAGDAGGRRERPRRGDPQ